MATRTAKGRSRFAKYTGQESDEPRQEIMRDPPDILLTNYVMLEFILTRPVRAAAHQCGAGTRFLVLDELHTYRGRQGADVALLVRRVRDRLASPAMQVVGTSATLGWRRHVRGAAPEVARVATQLFGHEVEPRARHRRDAAPRRRPKVAVDDLAFRLRCAQRV